MTYTVEILDNTLQPVTRIPAFVPLNTSGDILEYSNILSGSGRCRFRVATLEPVLTKYGNILQPFTNHVRVSRAGSVVWQGFILNEPHRRHDFIEVEAYTYFEMLKKYLIPHNVINDTQDTRLFNSGTLADAVSTTIAQVSGNKHNLYTDGITAGSISNPNFPAGFTNIAGADISGQPWTFSSNFQLSFDFKDAHYLLTAFAIYASYDIELTPALVLNFAPRIGADRPELVFEYSKYGMIESFDTPLDGKNQINHILGLGADDSGKLLKVFRDDTVAQASSGILDGVAPFNDVKNTNVMQQRLDEELRLVSTPDAELHVTLNDRAYPQGQYTVGDSATFKINWGPIVLNEPRQIVGVEVVVHNTGRERVILQTNKPKI